MPVSQAAPSPFAALLRRSKFASYDPFIGQVYTTHGGHAHRGNWGLKRPLPNRRRVGFITVRSIDSPEQQTEWNSAESSARWMRRWEELGKKLEVHELANWTRNPYSWATDTEFDKAGNVVGAPGCERRETLVSDPDNLIPDPEAMSPKQFKKYLNRLRALRPEFKKFLQDSWREQQSQQEQLSNQKHQTQQNRKHGNRKLESERKATGIHRITGSGDIDMFASSQNASNMFVDKFLVHRETKALESLESRRVEARPHNLAGLQYSFLSTLQSRYLHKPAPGRDVVQSRAVRFDRSARETKTDIIAVGGILGELKESGTQTIIPTDFGTQEAPRQNREQGKGIFLMRKVELLRIPLTVGQVPENAGAAKFASVEFSTPQLAKANSSNPYPLGSLDYVGWQDVNQSMGGAVLVPGHYVRITEDAKTFRSWSRPKNDNDKSNILDSLGDMISAKKNK